MNNDSNGRSMSKESVYRALTLGACGGALAWVKFHDLNRAIVAAVVTVIGTMGIEFGWWATVGDRFPAWAEKAKTAVLWLLSFLPAQSRQLVPYDIIFGWDAHNPRRPIVGNINRMLSFAIFGVTGTGKTSLIHSIIHDIIISLSPEEIKLVFFDPKQGLDFSIYGRLPHLAWPVASTAADTDKALDALSALMAYRGLLFSRIPDSRVHNNLSRYNHLNEELGLGLPKLEPVLVIVDEIQALIKNHKGAEALFEKVAKQGRAYGVFLVPCTQLPKADSLPTEIKAECYTRLIGRLSSARLYGAIAEVPKEIYESRPLREHEFYARINNQWEVVIANLIPYEDLEMTAAAVSAGCAVPEWPVVDRAGLMTVRPPARTLTVNTAVGQVSIPAQAEPDTAVARPMPSVAPIRWDDIRYKSEAVKVAQLSLYFMRFDEKPTAASTLDDIGWSIRTAEKWLPIVWSEIEKQRSG